jgi:hypothetical protein
VSTTMNLDVAILATGQGSSREASLWRAILVLSLH